MKTQLKHIDEHAKPTGSDIIVTLKPHKEHVSQSEAWKKNYYCKATWGSDPRSLFCHLCLSV